MSQKFKAGDRVRLIKQWAILNQGREGTIIESYHDRYPLIRDVREEYAVDFDRFGEAVWVSPDELELIPTVNVNAENTSRVEEETQASDDQETDSLEEEGEDEFFEDEPDPDNFEDDDTEDPEEDEFTK